MKKQIAFTLLTATLLFTACTSPEYKNGKKFTFDDKELESKLIYFCQNKPNLEPMNIRAKKTHAYFIKANRANADALVQDMMNDKPQSVSMTSFQQRTEALALNLHKKFSCTLIDTIDY